MKKALSILVLGLSVSTSVMAEEASWWDKTKVYANDTWQSASSTLSGWMGQANESETIQDIKQGAGDVAETLSDKETYKQAWDKTSETVGEWSDKAANSETYAQIKQGAGEVADKVTDKQTYVNAWEATKEAVGSVKESMHNSEGAKE